jgi:hypothetical protein
VFESVTKSSIIIPKTEDVGKEEQIAQISHMYIYVWENKLRVSENVNEHLIHEAIFFILIY